MAQVFMTAHITGEQNTLNRTHCSSDPLLVVYTADDGKNRTDEIEL